MEFQVVEQDLLVVDRLRDAADADVDPGFRGQHDIHESDVAEFRKHPARFISQARLLTHRRQRLPQHIRQEADQNVRQHPVCLLVPDGTDAQVTFVNAERRFSLSQLDVGFPQVFIAPDHQSDADLFAVAAVYGTPAWWCDHQDQPSLSLRAFPTGAGFIKLAQPGHDPLPRPAAGARAWCGTIRPAPSKRCVVRALVLCTGEETWKRMVRAPPPDTSPLFLTTTPSRTSPARNTPSRSDCKQLTAKSTRKEF